VIVVDKKYYSLGPPILNEYGTGALGSICLTEQRRVSMRSVNKKEPLRSEVGKARLCIEAV
jgi:hypothetical protein